MIQKPQHWTAQNAAAFQDASVATAYRHRPSYPNGSHPQLRWLHGPVEAMPLDPPYALVVAGESLHWMDWQVVLSRFQEILLPGGYLAIVNNDVVPDPWTTLAEVLEEYRTDGGYQPFDILTTLVQHGLFRQVGERRTAPVLFEQSIGDYIESYHARSGFSRRRMGQERADAFDAVARRLLLHRYEDGRIILQVSGRIIWGLPSPSAS